MEREYQDDLLRQVAAQATCMTDLMQRLEVTPTPGRRRHLWYRLREIGST